MRGTPSWDAIYHRDIGIIRDAYGIRIPVVRRAHFASGLCEVITCDAHGNRLLKADKSGPQTHYEKYDAPLTIEDTLYGSC